VASLASAGADLDLAVIGEAPVPACLGEVGDDAEPPFLAARAAAPIRATFRVHGEGEETPLPVVGEVGGAPVMVAPGRIRVAVDLDPPVDVGPVDLAPKASLRIRILELLTDGSRRWQVFVDGRDVRGAEASPP
jgi:hypothetical protein